MRLTIQYLDKNSKPFHKYTSSNKKRFSQKLSLGLEKIRAFKYRLRVVYAPDHENEGIYSTKKELLFAYKAFSDPFIRRLFKL